MSARAQHVGACFLGAREHRLHDLLVARDVGVERLHTIECGEVAAGRGVGFRAQRAGAVARNRCRRLRVRERCEEHRDGGD